MIYRYAYIRIINNNMEYSKCELETPRFGSNKNNKALSEELLEKRIQKYDKDIHHHVKNKDKYKRSKTKEKSKSKEKGKNKNKNKEKNKSKSKEKVKNQLQPSTQKKSSVSSISLPVEQLYKNPLDIFLKKKIKLRDDFDQNNSEKFLLEKEMAFQQFQMNGDADNLDI